MNDRIINKFVSVIKFLSNKSYFAFQAKGKIKILILTYKTLLNRHFTTFYINKNYQRWKKFSVAKETPLFVVYKMASVRR